MSTFLISKNNLSDVKDIRRARNNLGIGTLAIQNANDVNITGGSISVSNIVLMHENVKPFSFVVSKDDKGTLGFFYPEIREWIYQDQSDIDIGAFSNNMGYVMKEDLADVFFTGEYTDLEGIPSNMNDLFNESSFLLTSNNLSDLQDIEIAKKNLGLGPFASFTATDTVTISNLYVTNNFNFLPSRNNSDVDLYLNKYLRLKDSYEEDGSIGTEWVDLPVAGSNGNTYGLLHITNDYTVNHEYTAPSSRALRQVYDELNGKMVNTTDQEFMEHLIDKYGLLNKYNNLSELSENIREVKSNLNIGNLSEQNIDNVIVSNLTVQYDFRFTKLPFEGAYLRCDNITGEARWEDFPTAGPTTKGLVYTTHDLTGYIEDINFTVPNVYAVSNIFSELSHEIDSIESILPSTVRDLEDWRDFCLISDAFSNINAVHAKSNLGLHSIATTGNFLELDNIPIKLSEFFNDIFLFKNSNLSDLSNKAEARMNLGLGTLALQNVDTVEIVDGKATLNELTVNKSFYFNNIPSGSIRKDNQHFYLTASDASGKVSWSRIPEATEELYGVVQLTHDIGIKHSLHKVASATAVHKAFTILSDRIASINRRIDLLG